MASVPNASGSRTASVWLVYGICTDSAPGAPGRFHASWSAKRALKRAAPVEPRKERVTILLDAEMPKWYRGLGHGYQRRINAVLRAYMNGVISKAIERKGDRDAKGRLI